MLNAREAAPRRLFLDRKAVALVADAIRDVSKRKGIVLDPFCGSGTTIIVKVPRSSGEKAI